MELMKAEVARRQLGAALQLFIEDADPVSVHTLSCAGLELAHGLAEASGREPFLSITMRGNKDLTVREYHRLRTRYANSFKHFSGQDGKAREDEELIRAFDDTANDGHLFIGWTDLATAMGRMPIEAQSYQAWFFATRPDVLAPDVDRQQFEMLFPYIIGKSRQDQKEMLRKSIRKTKRDHLVMDDPRTERRKLLLPNNLPIIR